MLLPLHDGQTLPNLRPKSDAHQKQWLHRANWTCFEILPAFVVVGPWSAIMVVVVVIVFNYTSPKFHKLVFSDYRQSRMHSKKIINMYLYFSISCSQTSISDTCLCCHCQTKVPKIKMIRCVWRIQEFWHYWERVWILFYFPEHDIFVGERHIARAKAT